MKKFISFLLTFSMFCSMFSSIVFAAGSVATISEKVGTILNAIAYFGYAIAMGMLFYIGAKYTMASANEKADVKQGAIAYLIGVVLIVGASGIANIISSIALGGGGKTSGGLASEIVNGAIGTVK